MTRTTFLVAAVAGVFAFSLVGFAADPDPKSLAIPAADAARAADLVRQLGSPVYQDREDASRQLRALGRKAIAALEAGTDDPDLEVRHRCELLLPAAEAEDFAARLDTFLADADAKFDHDLPGWNEFKKRTGADGRGLFAELMKSPANRDLIAGVAQDKTELGRRLDARRQDLYQKMFPRGPFVPGAEIKRYDPTLADVVAFLLVDSIVGDAGAGGVAPRFAPVTGYTLLMRPTVRPAFDTDKHAAAARKIAGAWAESRTTPAGMYQAMNALSQMKLKESLGVAVKLMKDPASPPVYKAMAACAVARTGSAEHLPLVRGLFADDTLLMNRGTSDIRVRDTALAMAVLLTGQSLTDYGFQVQNVGGELRYYHSQWFPTDAARKAAFEKFAGWETKNPPADPKSPADKK